MRMSYGMKRLSSYLLVREIVALLLGVLTIFLFLSIFFHNPYDSSWFYYNSDSAYITNICGKAGANSAALLFYLFGAASLWLAGIPLVISYMLFYKRSWRDEWDRLLGLLLLTFVFATINNICTLDFLASSYPGGFFGELSHNLLFAKFDAVGATIFLYALVLICTLIITRLSFVVLVSVMMRYARKKLSGFSPLRHIVVPIVTLFSTVGAWFFKHSMRYCMRWFGSTPEAPVIMIDYDYAHDKSSSLVIDDWNALLIKSPDEKNTKGAPTSEPVLQKIEQSDQKATKKLDEKNLTEISYQLPDLSIFICADEKDDHPALSKELEQRARKLEEKLDCFGISGKVVAIKRGPVVTLFEYKPDIDTKISKIIALEDDLALALQALSIRIIAPIPGKSVVGFEVANQKRLNVSFAEIVQSSTYKNYSGLLPLILGKNTIGAHVIVDLAKMPHLLIAGSTGSGKSVALNAMLVSLLCKRTPKELKLVLIDPKRLEFSAYADCAQLLFPIVTNPKQAAPILQWVVKEMEERYATMATCGARNIADYNMMVGAVDAKPLIVVVIDELADLMMTAGRDIEHLIARITQMARAAGIHMLVATQRPSVDVITGLIKVNFPSRISFRVTSKIDSRTILDCSGADKLLGRGDMLFLDSADAQLKRVHGAYVSDQEISALMNHIRAQQPPEYLDLAQELPISHNSGEVDDALYNEVINYIQEIDEVSISLLQRKFRIGYNRSARMIDVLQARGLILPSDGGKTRKVVK